VIVIASLCLGTFEARAGSRRSPALADIARTYSPGPDVFQDQDPAPKKSWARRHPVWTTVIVVGVLLSFVPWERSGSEPA
jgi:hypothetical protein